MLGYDIGEFIDPLAAIRSEPISGLANYGSTVDTLVRGAIPELLKTLQRLDALTQIDFSTASFDALSPFQHVDSICSRLDGFMKVFEANTIFRAWGPLWRIHSKEELLLSEDVQQCLEKVSQIRRFVWRHLEHFQKLSRAAGAGSSGILNEQLDVNQLIQRVLELERNRHPIDFRYADVVIEPTDIPTFCADEARLLIGIRELLRNAVFATRIVVNEFQRAPVRHSSTVVVRTAMVDRRRFSIAIEDNGVGISPETLPKIRKFGYSTAQGEVTFGGLGIGIPTAIASITELGGEVVYDSDTTRGTIVTLIIPLPE